MLEFTFAVTVDDMRQHGVISTTSKGLKCKYVLHVAGHHFGNDWMKVVLSCLKEAEKLRDAQSVAFPLLGTGKVARTGSSRCECVNILHIIIGNVSSMFGSEYMFRCSS